MTKLIVFNQESKVEPIRLINRLSPDKRWVITIEAEKKRRTLSQNNLMWMWIDTICKMCGDERGYTKDEMARIFKQKFLVPNVVTLNGEEFIEYSTKKLSKKEMSEYMNHIEMFAAQEFGVFVPVPEDLQRNY